jgi:dihydrolipoamide dehydrogenase
MEERSFDVVVLGGGPGGYPCAIRLGQLGLSVACVEGEEYGGVCLNWGCIPSKALISTAHQYEKAGKAGEQGLGFGAVSIDVGKMQGWKNGLVKKLTGGVRHLLKQNGAEAIEGMGRLVDSKTVEVTRANGEQLRVRATRGVVIATGSTTIQIPGFEFDGRRIIGAREAVSLPELTENLLPGVDPDAVKIVERSISKKGGRVLKQAKAERWEQNADGSVAVVVSTGGASERIDADVVLVAVGMRPRSRGIGLEEIGVAVDQRGFVSTDAQCKTNVPGVYAVGDVSGPPMLAHKATKEGEICAEVIAGKASGKDWVTIPGIVFTDPEIAMVGLTEAAAKEQGFDVKVGRFPFAALGRAMSIRETDGFVKIVTDASTKRVLGIHIVGPSASDLISEAALALEMAATAEDIALTVHPHPTLGEALMEAAAHSLGHAIHITNR